MENTRAADITVVVHTYNHAQFIGACLDSIYSQVTNKKFHVIIRDDASDDGTREIIEKYKNAFPNCTTLILEETNTYSSGVMPSAVTFPLIRSRYFCLCEGDDNYLVSSHLDRLAQGMETHGSLMAYSGAVNVVIDEGGNEISRQVRDCRSGETMRGWPAMIGSIGGFWATSAAMFDSIVLKDFLLLREHHHTGDGPLTVAAMRRSGPTVIQLGYIGSQRNIHRGGVVGSTVFAKSVPEKLSVIRSTYHYVFSDLSLLMAGYRIGRIPIVGFVVVSISVLVAHAARLVRVLVR